MTDSQKLDLLLDKFESMESRMEGMESRMEGMESRMEGMESRMDTMESEILNVKLTLENEISPNVKIIAEGHLDLSRNLHEAMKPSNALELLMVQVNILESKVRDLEQKISA